MSRDDISAEQTLFAIDDAQARITTVADDLARLVAQLRAQLPDGAAGDVTRPIDELARQLRGAVDDGRLERARAIIMEHGVPLDDVACGNCGSADFSNESCDACCAVRSDGARHAQRLAGWTV